MQLMASTLLDLHTLLEVPIKRERLKSICHMIVLMKVIKSMFHKKELDIIQSLPHVINLAQADITSLLLMAKDKLQSEISKGSQASKIRILSSFIRGGKDADTSQFDSLSLVSIALKMLQGGGSNVRRLSLLISLDALQSIGYLDFEYSRIKKLISKVATVADFQRIVEEVTDCSFLYWRKEMMRTWFSMIYTDGNKFSWLQYFLDGCADGLWLLRLGNVGEFTLHLHEEEIEDAVKTEIIAPLCRDIETDLRLHVHSIHLEGSVRVNPRKTGVSNLSWYLELKPLRLPFKCIDLKSHVKRYLNSVFYNHSAMASYDCKIYSDMKHLAELKYGMVLDHHLPVCFDHELEVIEIVHNLPHFSQSYSYNMINQVFIEKITGSQGQKTLRVLGVGNVVNSVTVHGVGIISTASDSVTTFLTQKITDLSDFLQDNVVSFHSLKEFNFGKVESHNLVTRKLPFRENEMWFLERLFSIIIEMGNGIGLLRVLQTGGSRHIGSVSQFIPKHTSIQSFAEISQNLGFLDGTVLAGKLMDLVVKNRHQTDEWMRSFPSLLAELSKEIKHGENIFFRDFYLIIPALVLSYVHSTINWKDNNFRRLQSGVDQMTRDDGFMMGAAFILKFMEQEKNFDALHWLSGAREKLDEALSSLEETKHRGQRKDSVGLTALKLWGQSEALISPETQKDLERLKEYQKELELIHSGICVARTLMS
ncbi:hypothetical protein Scep_006323 [Stephania cephalantha]|uniref:Uncharacterized protein n=1 Tax=Stephania cephalantha TaxID=152367 RepID=A0AAP0PNW6_9MAGN